MPILKEAVALAQKVAAAFGANIGLAEAVVLRRATAVIEHRDASGKLLSTETVTNVLTDSGRDFIHAQVYGTAPGANGLNYIGLSNDALTENAASTVLSSEIAANGLTRAQGAVAHTVGTNTSTVQKVFTCATAPQAAQKAALFSAAAAGTMNHALAFTQRSLQIGDTLTVTFTLTIG